MTDDVDPTEPRRHPAQVDLAAFADGDLHDAALRDHVAECALCRELLAGLGARLGDIAVDIDAAATLPEELLHFLGSAPLDDPAPGELWQLEWNEESLLAAVVGHSGDHLAVLPVSGEAPPPGSSVVVIPQGASPLPIALYVWLDAVMEVPLGVFLHRAGDIAVPADLGSSATSPSGGWAEALQKLDLMHTLDALSVAAWVPPEDDPPVDLRELMRQRQIRPSDVERQTSLRAADVTAMIQGRRHATDQEAAELGSVLGVSPSTIAGSVSLPTSLIRAMERPAHRAAVRLQAWRRGVTEAAERLDVAQKVLAMPARTSAETRDVAAWDELIRQHLDA